MAQIVVRRLAEDVKRRLAARAALAGHSMEEEARQILTAATIPSQEEGLGARIARHMKGRGMTADEHRIFEDAIAEQRGKPWRNIDLSE